MPNFNLTPWTSNRPLARWGRDPFSVFRNEFDRLFDDFFGTPATDGGEGQTAVPVISPRLDVSETEKAYEIAVELPGVAEKDLDLTVADGVLTIKGEKRTESEDKTKSYHRVERHYGAFERRLSLPAEADAAKIDAAFRNGVLTVTVPKTETATSKQRRIDIKSR